MNQQTTDVLFELNKAIAGMQAIVSDFLKAVNVIQSIQHDLIHTEQKAESIMPLAADNYPPVLETKDIMKILGISRSKAYDFMRTPGFPVIRDGRHNRYIVPRDAFFKWLNEDAFQKHSLK